MDYFDEENDFDLAVLAKKINEGTAYMVNTKAGYDYARLCTIDKTYNDEGQEIDDYSFSINSEGAIAGNTVLSVVLGAVFNVVDKITIGMDKNLGTNIRTDKWTCKNSTSEDEETKQDICTADKPIRFGSAHVRMFQAAAHAARQAQAVLRLIPVIRTELAEVQIASADI